MSADSGRKQLFRQASWGTRFITNTEPFGKQYLVWCQGLLLFKQQFATEDLDKLIRKLLDIPRFRSRYDFEKHGFSELPKDSIDMGYHLTVIQNKQVSMKDVLEHYMGNMFESFDVNFEKPLWYCLYFPTVQVEDGTRSILLLNISHVIGDGVSLIGLIFNLMDKNLDLNELRAESSKTSGAMVSEKKSEVQTEAQSTTKALEIRKRKKVNHNFGPFNLLLIFLKGIWDAFFASLALLDSKTPLCRSKDDLPSSQKSIAIAAQIPLDKVKQVKNKFEGATVNDVLIAVLNLAMLGYLKEQGLEPTELKRKQIRASFPINTRKQGEPLLKDDSPSNHFSMCFFNFVTEASSRIEMVHKVKQIIDKIKLSPMPFVQSWLGLFSSAMLPRSVVAKMFFDYNNQFTSQISNVPGPQSEVSLQGYGLEDLHFGIYTPAGLYMGLMSYNNKVGCTICLDGNLGNAADLAKHWNREFELMYEEVMNTEGIIKQPKTWRSYFQYL